MIVVSVNTQTQLGQCQEITVLVAKRENIRSKKLNLSFAAKNARLESTVLLDLLNAVSVRGASLASLMPRLAQSVQLGVMAAQQDWFQCPRAHLVLQDKCNLRAAKKNANPGKRQRICEGDRGFLEIR